MQSLIIKYKLDETVRTLDLNRFGVCIYERVKIPTARMRYDTIEVPGRDGTLNIEQGYDDIEFDVTLNTIDKALLSNLRSLKLKLMNTVEFMLSDDRSVFYKVKSIEIDDIENDIALYGKFTVTFRCDPFAYSVNGSKFKKFEGEHHPMYYSRRHGVVENDGVPCNSIWYAEITQGSYAFDNVALTINGITCAEACVDEGYTLVYNTITNECYIKDTNNRFVKSVERVAFNKLKHGTNIIDTNCSGGNWYYQSNIKYL